MTPWLIWLIAAIVLLTAEVLSGAIVALCLSVGCLAAIIPAAIDAPIVVQFVVASVGAIAAFFILFPIIRKYKLNKAKGDKEKSNMDAMIGRIGCVAEPIVAEGQRGRVTIDGVSWLAEAEAGYCPIPKGESVEIVSFDSIVLIVKPKR